MIEKEYLAFGIAGIAVGVTFSLFAFGILTFVREPEINSSDMSKFLFFEPHPERELFHILVQCVSRHNDRRASENSFLALEYFVGRRDELMQIRSRDGAGSDRNHMEELSDGIPERVAAYNQLERELLSEFGCVAHSVRRPRDWNF